MKHCYRLPAKQNAPLSRSSKVQEISKYKVTERKAQRLETVTKLDGEMLKHNSRQRHRCLRVQTARTVIKPSLSNSRRHKLSLPSTPATLNDVAGDTGDATRASSCSRRQRYNDVFCGRRARELASGTRQSVR